MSNLNFSYLYETIVRKNINIFEISEDLIREILSKKGKNSNESFNSNIPNLKIFSTQSTILKDSKEIPKNENLLIKELKENKEKENFDSSSVVNLSSNSKNFSEEIQKNSQIISFNPAVDNIDIGNKEQNNFFKETEKLNNHLRILSNNLFSFQNQNQNNPFTQTKINNLNLNFLNSLISAKREENCFNFDFDFSENLKILEDYRKNKENNIKSNL